MTNLFQISGFTAFTLNIVIGLTVYFMNPRRRTNRYFLFTSLVLACWLACLTAGSLASGGALVIFWIRYATVSSCLLLPAFDMLRLSIVGSDEKKDIPLREVRFWVLLLIPELILLHLPRFILDVRISPSGFPQPVYGWPQIFFMYCYLYGLAVLIRRFVVGFRRSRGIQRSEMGFAVLGFCIAAFLGVLIGQVIPMTSNNPDVPQLLPLVAVVYDVILAYGIATRRIMNVSEVLRRATSYILLAGYMVLLYLALQFASQWVFAWFLSNPSAASHLLAAIVVAFSVAPAHGRSQEVASRLFVNVEKMDVRKTVRKVQDLLSHIGPLDDLTQRFGDMLRTAAGTDRLFLLAARNGSYEQVYPIHPEGAICRIPADDALIDVVRQEGEPVTVEALTRQRSTPAREAAMRSLKTLDTNLAVGVYSKERMDLLMLLGRRLSGRIYGHEEQDALQIVCNQFAVAFENAKLYTQLQDSKIYSDILVDSLVSGIIAVHSDGKVSVFNREAQRITGIVVETILGAPMEKLPPALVSSFGETFRSGEEIMDRELVIERNDEMRIPIRLSCSVFHNHAGALLGVLGVFSDLTLLKKLEDQVRRSDRLSSIGTLAAGMAHEIKNPLVSISTFTQLLPERYEDEDFRNTFSRLIGKEVQRIDSIVSRLLKFSRPAKPFLKTLHLHDALEDSMNLIAQQLRRKDIRLTKRLDAVNDLINGDVDLLSQAFINFFLNAIEAMEEGGTLTVSTAEIRSKWYSSRVGGGGTRIRLGIADTGCGISAKDLSRIFDPFFTTKSSGTGLGLSVSHSIIDEHDATLEVETEEGKGTTFQILFPLLSEKEYTP